VISKRFRVDVAAMPDVEVQRLIAEASRREREMPDGFTSQRRTWTALRVSGEAELRRRKALR
jgi:hypothetical protein